MSGFFARFLHLAQLDLIVLLDRDVVKSALAINQDLACSTIFIKGHNLGNTLFR
jgi:hypothetical protein